MRSGTVALVGRANVGKSTFLNAALGEPLVIVSARPQTTREAILGVVHRGDAELRFLDTPGLHRPRSELGRRMNAAALEALRAADVAVLMTELPAPVRGDPRVPEEDRRLAGLLEPERPALLVVNKIDRVRDKRVLLPWLEAYAALHDWRALVPVSVLADDGVDRVLDALAEALPERPHRHSPEEITDRSLRWLAAEYVREQALALLDREVPHALAVTIDQWTETSRRVRIDATIHVEKSGQRTIVVGRGGARLKELGTAARARIERLLERPVRLELFVRVTDRWRETPRRLAELGYPEPGAAADPAPERAPPRRGPSGRGKGAS